MHFLVYSTSGRLRPGDLCDRMDHTSTSWFTAQVVDWNHGLCDRMDHTSTSRFTAQVVD